MSFTSDLDVGHIGERIAWDILNEISNVIQIVDVRKDKRYQAADIDLMFETTTKQFFYVEVKTDKRMNETGNIIYETKTTENVGCMVKTKADYLFQYDYVGHIMYVIDIKRLRDFVNKRRFTEVKISDDTRGYLIPIADLKENGLVSREYEVNA